MLKCPEPRLVAVHGGFLFLVGNVAPNLRVTSNQSLEGIQPTSQVRGHAPRRAENKDEKKEKKPEENRQSLKFIQSFVK